MPIRDIIVMVVILGSLPFCLMRPYIGVLVWSWISFMNPHRLTWGFAYNMPFAQIVAIPTLLGLLITKDRRKIPFMPETVLLAIFWGMTVISTLFALDPLEAWSDLDRFSKILLMTFVTIMLAQDRGKLHLLLLIVAMSIGFYGLKGGLWVLSTGGKSGWVVGPEYSFIGDNNGLALGLNMTLPILSYLAREEKNLWLRRMLYAVLCFSIVGVLLTYSRGGFLGLLVVAAALTARSKFKLYAITVALVGTLLGGVFLSQRWFDRMHSISEYEKDNSAMGRIDAWTVAWNIALERPLIGGGHRVVEREDVWKKYSPKHYQGTSRNVHSIYFQVLAEHGFLGFFIFLSLLGATLFSLHKIRRTAKFLKDGEWLINYSYMVETGLAAFLVTGAFQNLVYFDLFYFLIAVTVILKQLVKEALVVSMPSAERPVPKLQPLGRPGYAFRS